MPRPAAGSAAGVSGCGVRQCTSHCAVGTRARHWSAGVARCVRVEGPLLASSMPCFFAGIFDGERLQKVEVHLAVEPVRQSRACHTVDSAPSAHGLGARARPSRSRSDLPCLVRIGARQAGFPRIHSGSDNPPGRPSGLCLRVRRRRYAEGKSSAVR